MKRKIIDMKKDRLRYTKNSLSSTLAIVAIVFNVLYFVSIYNTLEADVGFFYYSMNIGASVICNLLFLLFTFLCSEGIKNYKNSFAYGLIGLGVFQLIRILGIPMDAHSTFVEATQTTVMSDTQFYYACICLVLSAVACFASAVVGIIKTSTLRNYEKLISEEND